MSTSSARKELDIIHSRWGISKYLKHILLPHVMQGLDVFKTRAEVSELRKNDDDAASIITTYAAYFFGKEANPLAFIFLELNRFEAFFCFTFGS